MTFLLGIFGGHFRRLKGAQKIDTLGLQEITLVALHIEPTPMPHAEIERGGEVPHASRGHSILRVLVAMNKLSVIAPRNTDSSTSFPYKPAARACPSEHKI